MAIREHAVAVLIALVGSVAAAEVGLRIFTSHNSNWSIRLGAGKIFDPVTRFRNRPHYAFRPGIATNERGYLAPSHLLPEKPKDRFRFIFIGDSVTFLPVGDSYPVHLANIARSETGYDVESVNTAVPGFASENARAMLESELVEFDADVLFIYLGWNDLGQYGPEGLPYKRRHAGYELNALERFVSQSYTIRLVYALQRFVDRLRPAVDEPLTPEEELLYDSYYPSHFEDNLRAMLTLAKNRYPGVVVMNLATITSSEPTQEELAKAHFPVGMGRNMRKLDRLVARYNEVVGKVAREEEVVLVDLKRAFDSREARSELTDSCHVTPTGARRIAKSVWRAIGPRLSTRERLLGHKAASVKLPTPRGEPRLESPGDRSRDVPAPERGRHLGRFRRFA